MPSCSFNGMAKVHRDLQRLVAAGALVVAAVGCSLTQTAGEGAPAGDELVRPAAFPAAMAPLPDGGLIYGERLTGRLRVVTPRGRLDPKWLARVDVSSEGQRGLLGVAVAPDGRIFAAWTRRDGVLVVGEVWPKRRLTWLGPPSSERANGGHIVMAPNGALVLGVGDLGQPELVDDPDTPNGKILRLDPDGPPDQTPEVVSSGWNNPFAFTFTSGGELWVADNAPGSEFERLARGDVGGRPSAVLELAHEIAPSGIAHVGDGMVAVCGFLSRRLELYDVSSPAGSTVRGEPLADGCALGVTRLTDGRLAFADEDTIWVVDPKDVR